MIFCHSCVTDLKPANVKMHRDEMKCRVVEYEHDPRATKSLAYFKAQNSRKFLKFGARREETPQNEAEAT